MFAHPSNQHSQRSGIMRMSVLAIAVVVAATIGVVVTGCHDPHPHADVVFVNHTSDIVDVFIDGRYRATLSGFAEVGFVVSVGGHDLYAEDYTGGGAWGPIYVYLHNRETFVYDLYP